MNDDEILEELGRALGHDPTRTPPPDRVAAIRAAAEQMQPQHRAESSGADRSGTVVPIGHRSRRRMFLAGGIAAGVGGIAGYVGRDLTDESPPPEAGPPIEDVAFDTPDGVSVEAGLINHTWGTELLLDVSGLRGGTTYDVVYRTTGGAEVAAGSLLAVSDVLMKCRFNAAPVRADVRGIEVRDGDDVVLETTLPTLDA